MADSEKTQQGMGATVRSVAPVDRKGQEFAVTFDGGASLTLTVAVIAEFGIAPGKVFQAGDLDALRRADVRQRATEAAVRYLGLRPRSTHEIQDYLHRKGYSPETVETAVGMLTERGYLDDLAFARWWAENRAQFQPRGPHLIRQELRRKGVTSATIDETLAEQAETVDTDAQALALARSKLRSFHKNGLEPEIIARRLSGLLARRGYGYDIVRTVLKTLRDNGELNGDIALEMSDD
ncbi:MAG: regulatory protein RecX [Thermomicrobiales bacterium]